MVGQAIISLIGLLLVHFRPREIERHKKTDFSISLGEVEK